jgi:hypothetical protein
MRAYQALTALAAPLGLHAQPATCAVYSEEAAAATAVADHFEVQHAPKGCGGETDRHPSLPSGLRGCLRQPCLPADGGAPGPAAG